MHPEFHFLRPLWLLALLLAPFSYWWLRRRANLAGAWLRVVAPELRRYVLDSTAPGGRPAVLPAVAALLISFAVVALAGPAWERQTETLYRSGDALVVVLDLSHSMDAGDLPPSRVVRARLKLLDLLDRRTSGQTALIVYSANAFTVVPLTEDSDTIRALVSSLSTDIMPSAGTSPSVALAKARRLLEQAGATNGRVLMIADGGFSQTALERAAELAEAGFPVSVLGVGTTAGGPIPAAEGGFESDRSGQVVVAHLEEQELRRIAVAGGGQYQRITNDSRDLERLLAGDSGVASGIERTDGGKTAELWKDRGPWLVVLLLPLAASLFRRGWLVGIAAFALLLPAPREAQALSLKDLWLTRDQQGQRYLDRQRPGEAAAVFEDDAWRGAALYRAEDYEAAAAALGALDTADAHYNRGNALARAGKVEAAIDAYARTLAIDPEHEDALFNKTLLEKQQQGGGDSGENSGAPEEGAEQQSAGAGKDEPASGETGENSQNTDSAEDSGSDASGSNDMNEPNTAAGEPEDEQLVEELQRELRQAGGEAAGDSQPSDAKPEARMAMTEEERAEQEREEATEQWLRRIPDDPGGLLRRKFYEQYRRQGRDQDGNSLWPDDTEEPW